MTSGSCPGHAPLLGLLQGGTVQVRTVDDEYFVAAAPDGFISVANDRVSILAENAEMGHDIDLEEARRDARAGAGRPVLDTDEETDEVRLAEARVRAAETDVLTRPAIIKYRHRTVRFSGVPG